MNHCDKLATEAASGVECSKPVAPPVSDIVQPTREEAMAWAAWSARVAFEQEDTRGAAYAAQVIAQYFREGEEEYDDPRNIDAEIMARSKQQNDVQ